MEGSVRGIRRSPRLAIGGVALIILTGLPGGVSVAGAKSEPVEHRLLASQKRVPREIGLHKGRLALTKSAYRHMWDHYRMRGERPRVNLERKRVLFVGFGESGSCPLRFESLRLNEKHKTFKVGGRSSGTDCTDDWTPRAFVIAVAKGDIPGGKLKARVDSGSRMRVRRVR